MLGKSREYLEYIAAVEKAFRSGKYATAVLHLNYMIEEFKDNEWRKDLGIAMSQGDDDFWSNLCIFNLCAAGTEGCIESGCGQCCCGAACVVFCIGTCCGGDPAFCMTNMIIKSIECCCSCLQADCCCE